VEVKEKRPAMKGDASSTFLPRSAQWTTGETDIRTIALPMIIDTEPWFRLTSSILYLVRKKIRSHDTPNDRR
jgi:hypothetical protein